MKQITLQELETWRKSGIDFQLIDVREPEEHLSYNIGGELIPLSKIIGATDRLELEKPIVLYCKRGIRSQLAIQRLSIRLADVDLYNLEGGILPLIRHK